MERRKANGEDVMIFRNRVIKREDHQKLKDEASANSKATPSSNGNQDENKQWLKNAFSTQSTPTTTKIRYSEKSTGKKKKTDHKNQKLNILYANVDILSNKKLELETLLDQNKIDIALLCETLPKKTRQKCS